MSLDMNELLAKVKRAAVEAVMAKKPMSVTFGKVIAVDPLKIYIDQKTVLEESQLILTNAVRDYRVNMVVDHLTERAYERIESPPEPCEDRVKAWYSTRDYGTDELERNADELEYFGAPAVELDPANTDSRLWHTHGYKGTKSFLVLLGLKLNERVILIRVDGGKKFIVLDRVEALQ